MVMVVEMIHVTRTGNANGAGCYDGGDIENKRGRETQQMPGDHREERFSVDPGC